MSTRFFRGKFGRAFLQIRLADAVCKGSLDFGMQECLLSAVNLYVMAILYDQYV